MKFVNFIFTIVKLKIMQNNTLKEYYVKLEKLWSDGLNVLEAINKALSTNAQNVEIKTSLTGDTYKIPSFLYLENKLELLSNNFSSLFNLPESGEAWLTADDHTNSFKLQMVRTGVSPVSPKISQRNKIVASVTDNNILKDMVSPKTYLKLNIDNLPENVEHILMRKYVFNNVSTFESLEAASQLDDFDLLTHLYTYRKGIDYDVYDSELSLPLKRDKFHAQFIIEEVIGNPTIVAGKYTYKIRVNTLKYTNADDPSIEYSLKDGDKLCLGNKSSVFTVKGLNINKNEFMIEELVGHSAVQSYDEDESMILGIYINDFSEYHYVNVPLEENPYIAVCLATIQSNVRSAISDPIFINLNNIEMTDANGQPMYDENLNKMNYIQYYNKFCTNIGDLILGLTEAAYPQLSNLTSNQLESLQTDDTIKSIVSTTIDSNVILKVLPINKHIIDNTTTEELIQMHAQKNELNSQINALNNNISDVNNTLTTTDFSQEVAVTQSSLRSQLTQYYNDRTVLMKQLIGVVENINTNVGQIEGKQIKYRIRGVSKTDELEKYLKANYSDKLDLIGIDVEYKYKALNKETTSVVTINSSVFTDWNKLETIDKQRLVQTNGTGGFNLVFENYDATNNIIKWNQIDIPITADEDVVIRIRYKYNIGQPFINIYSPWSDEITVTFPVEYKDNVDVNAIISENQNDVISAKFNATLINEGYADHINNSIKSQDITFFHSPENIYSGFNSPDNVMISLKDKLQEMSTTIEKYQNIIASEINTKYQVYLVYDNQQIELLPNKLNEITIYNADHIVDSFIKKKMTLVFKNTGELPVKMYSIFPGNTSTPLIFCADSFYEKRIGNYERVPVIANETTEYQRLGQWIYFRQNNPWTGKDIYYNNEAQNRYDWLSGAENGCAWNSTDTYALMKQDFNQVLFGWRRRPTGEDTYLMNTWKTIFWDKQTNKFVKNTGDNIDFSNKDKIDSKYANVDNTFFMYKNIANEYLTRYEDIFYDDNGTRYYLDSESSLSEFVTQHRVPGNFTDDIDFTGAFLFPELVSINSILTGGSVGDYTEIPVGSSLTVPVTLEFYLNEDLTSIVKGLYFDIKPSAYSEPLHFMLEVTALYDYTASGNLLGNVSLVDEVIE